MTDILVEVDLAYLFSEEAEEDSEDKDEDDGERAPRARTLASDWRSRLKDPARYRAFAPPPPGESPRGSPYRKIGGDGKLARDVADLKRDVAAILDHLKGYPPDDRIHAPPSPARDVQFAA